MLICSQVDNETLRSLSRTCLWNTIREFASCQNFWFLRVQKLAGKNLSIRSSICWKDVYYDLEQCLRWPLGSVNLTQDCIALEILLDINRPPHYVVVGNREGWSDELVLLLARASQEHGVSFFFDR